MYARYDITVYDGFAAGAVDKPTLAIVLVCVDVPCCGKCFYTQLSNVSRKHLYISAIGTEFNTFVTNFFFCLKLHINLRLSRTKHAKQMAMLKI